MEPSTPDNNPQPNPAEPTGAPAVNQSSDERRPIPVSDFRKSSPSPAQDITPPAPAPAPPVTTTPAPVVDAPADKPSDQTAPQPVTPAPKPHSGKPMGAVIAAIFIGLLLAGLSVFAYLKTKDADKSATPPPAASQSTLSPQDVDKTTEEIDKTLESANQAEDLNANDLTDTTLGL